MELTLQYLQRFARKRNSCTLADAQHAIGFTNPKTLCIAVGVTNRDPHGVYDDICHDIDTLAEDLGEGTPLTDVIARIMKS